MAQNTKLHAVRHFYTAAEGLITLEDDVLSIVRQVREIYSDNVTVEVDPDTGYFHFVGHENGTDYLIFSTPELDGRAFTRLLSSDSHWRDHTDPYDAAEREQDELDREKEYQQRQKISEMGEELVHALQKDGQAPFLPKQVYIPRGINANR